MLGELTPPTSGKKPSSVLTRNRVILEELSEEKFPRSVAIEETSLVPVENVLA
jgi:hypothetical protein